MAEREPEVRPLHGGRHKLSPEMVSFSQRERLLSALASTVAERGYNEAGIAQIAEAARVSRRTFYELFSSKEECFCAAFDAVDSHVSAQMFARAGEEKEWSDQVAAALVALVGFLAERPQLARLYLVEPAAVGSAMTSRIEQIPERYIAALRQGRARRTQDRDLAEGIEEALVGGVMTLLTRRIVAGEAEELERFAPSLIEFVLAPYLGVDGARSVAARHS